MSHDISSIMPLEISPISITIPFYEGSVQAGQSRFVSAAQDYEVKDLDIQEFLIKDPPATFIVQVARDADSMVDAGIHPKCMLIVNRALAPRARSSNIVVAIVNGEFIVKRLYKKFKSVRLLSENNAKAYPPIDFTEDQELMIWGVVQHAIISFP